MKQSVRERFNISRLAIRYAKITVMVWIAVAVAGFLAFMSLKYALFPDVPFPVVVVNASAPLETVLDTEAKLTNPLEASLSAINYFSLYSSTFPGQSAVSVAFSTGSNIDASTQAVKDAIKTASLPANASVEVTPFNLNESTVASYAIDSESKALEELAAIVRLEVVPQLKKVSGVLRVDLLGDAAFRQTSDDSASPTQNPPTLVRFNGRDSLAVRVVKRADANLLEVANGVEKVVEQLHRQNPDVKLSLAETQADYVREAIHVTVTDFILAVILSILVIFPFLRDLRATLIASLAIPLSLLGTCIVMAIAGFNLETLTLLALTLVIGIIVDDAIVDVENISRHIEAGEKPLKAAIKGTDEIGLTVTASTLAIAAVFLPIALMGGTLGQFFKPFGLTVAASVLISLLVARTLSPVLAVYWLKSSPKSRNNEISVRKMSLWTYYYRHLLEWSLRHRKAVIGLAIASFLVGIALIPLIPQGFVPQLDRGEFNIVYTSPLPKVPSRLKAGLAESEGNNNQSSLFGDIAQSPERFLLRRTRRVGRQLEEVVLADTDVKSAYTTIGVRGNPLQGKIYVELKGDRTATTSEIEDRMRQNLPKLPGVSVSIQDILFVETGDDTPLKIALVGDNLETLKQTAQQLKSRVAQLPGLVDVKVSSEGESTSIIEHLNGHRTVYLSANLGQGTALGNATNEVVAIARSLLPPDVTLDLEGDSARVGMVFGEFGMTLALALVCMIVVVYIPFGRWLEPLVIVLSLPLAIVGAMVALLITQSAFGMISLIGLIFLLGLLNKNAILLLDYINQLRQKGMNRHDAILETGTVRLRPIIMTTVSTLLGMLPIALGLGAGAELRQPMAVAIMGGLITSTLLSLIVVPVLYTLLEDGWMQWSGERAIFAKKVIN